MLSAAAEALTTAFPDPWLRSYSVKANDVPAIIERLAAAGMGANVVSRGEWARARAAGVANDRITLEGVGKTPGDLRAAVRAAARSDPLRWVALESLEELDDLTGMAASARLGTAGRPPVDVLLRLNPAVEPETHSGLAVGRATSKFGMTQAETLEAAGRIAGHGPIRLRGLHLHVGSQLGGLDAWREAVAKGLAQWTRLAAEHPSVDTFDVGGGFPASDDPSAPRPADFGRTVESVLREATPRPPRLAIEPGRFLVAQACQLVAAVLHVREREDGERIVVLDTGMTELIRPAMYGASHPIVALTSLGEPVTGQSLSSARVDGPVCESTDTLGRHQLPLVRRGDLVAIEDAGAYGASMAMTYNGRPLAPQVLVEPDGTMVRVGRRLGAGPR
jgi:diaminopimelate decarboxylase